MNRRIFIIAISSILALGISLPNAVSSGIYFGTPCTKAGAIAKVGTLPVKCTKVGLILLWQGIGKNGAVTSMQTNAFASGANPFKVALAKAAAAREAAAKAAEMRIKKNEISCVEHNQCLVGNVGPGGGIVFYDAGTRQPWGRFLEAAPRNWSHTGTDPISVWCNISNVSLKSVITDPALANMLGVEIGKGQANTELEIAGCASGASNLAAHYRGGGKSDWFLPSKDELNEMNKTKVMIGGFTKGYYWSSSENDAYNAWDQNFTDGAQNLHLKNHKSVHVRPIRAF